MENPRFKVRAFDRVFDVDTDRPLRASAVIDDAGVLVIIDGSQHRLPAVERGQDEWGEFALIEPGEWKLNFGFVLTVEVELHEDEPYGCCIALRRPQPEEVLKEAHDAVRAQGMDPESSNVLLPPTAAVSIFFNHWGTMNGHSRLRSAPPADTQSRTH
jgi:hypothetical protein